MASAKNLFDLTSREPLIPNNILTMKSSIVLPPPGRFFQENIYLSKRCIRVQFLAKELWQRWKRENFLSSNKDRNGKHAQDSQDHQPCLKGKYYLS